MSLSSAIGIAQSALSNTAAQTALLSRNIANVGNANYSRLTPTSTTRGDGSVATGTAERASANALLTSLLSAQSQSTGAQALDDGLSQIASSLGLDASTSTSSTSSTSDNSPATALAALATALQQYAAQPDNSSLATAAVSAAKAVATNLNNASTAVQAVRSQADSDIATSVSTINNLLAQFQTANTAVVAGTRAGQDTSAAADTRDGILKQLSAEIGVQTTSSGNGGLSIYTDSGVTLFETTPRTVAFTPTTTFTASTVGNAVTVDGVAVTGSSAVMPINSGRLAGLSTLRNTTTVAYQNQLDQVAAGLVTAFAESDQTGSGASTLPGLFMASTLNGLPSSTTTTGLAASLQVNSRVDPTQGGDVTRLRDGNIASAASAYTYNTTGAAAFGTRLSSLATSLAQTRSFDASTGGTASGSLQDYATSSVAWLEAQRQTSSTTTTSSSALVSSATTALSNATGVNLDDQMSQMLDIEHAYQASAQLMNTVNAMYASLIQAFN